MSTMDWEFNNWMRSEEHTSELQSHSDLVCRLLLEKKKQLSQREKREMFCRVKVRDAVSTDCFLPFIDGQFKSMIAINGLPDQNFGRLRIKDQPVEIKYKCL